jgi:hypothetical protein
LAVKFSGEFVLLQVHYRDSQASAEASTSSKNDSVGKSVGKLAAGKKN